MVALHEQSEMNPGYLTQLGVGGLFAYVIIRETFSFLSGRNGNGKNGSSSGNYSYLTTQLVQQKAQIDALVLTVGNMQATVAGVVSAVDRGFLPRVERLERFVDRVENRGT